MKKKILNLSSQILFYTLMVLALITGILLYRVFMSYIPGVNLAELFQGRTGIPFPLFAGISAGVFISIPLLIVVLRLLERYSVDYILAQSESGLIHLSNTAIHSFIYDVVSEMAGVEYLEVNVVLYRENYIGLKIWIDTNEKSDFVRFSERVQQRVLQDLEFNFGVKLIRYFHVYLESTNINASGTGYKLGYK